MPELELQSERDFEINCLKDRITTIVEAIQVKAAEEIPIPKAWAKELVDRLAALFALESKPLTIGDLSYNEQ